MVKNIRVLTTYRTCGVIWDKAKEELGCYTETTFEVVIKKTINWYFNN